MMENIENLTKMITPWLLDATVQALVVQYLIIAAAGLFHIYQILRMRRDTVVVVSNGRIWFGALLCAAVSLGYYRAALHLQPKGVVWWKFALFMLALFITYMILKLLLYAIVRPFVGERRSLIDTKMKETEKFNCNWPLIPRCVHQALSYILWIGVALAHYLSSGT